MLNEIGFNEKSYHGIDKQKMESYKLWITSQILTY